MTDVAVNAAQAEYWNGRAGDTWVELQRLLDMELRPLGGRRRRPWACGRASACSTSAAAAARPAWTWPRPSAPPGRCWASTFRVRCWTWPRGGRRTSGFDLRFAVAADAQTTDFLAPDFGGARFDAAFSRFGVMFFADPPAAFANIRRALKPGGRLAFVCWRPASENPVMTAPMKAAESLIPPQPPSDPLAPGPFAFADPQRVRRVLGEAGFGQVAIRPFDAQVGGWTPEEALTVAQRVGPLGTVLRENPDLRPKVLDAVDRALQRHTGADGKVRAGSRRLDRDRGGALSRLTRCRRRTSGGRNGGRTWSRIWSRRWTDSRRRWPRCPSAEPSRQSRRAA